MRDIHLVDIDFMVDVPIIGYVRSPYPEKFGVPRQANLVDIPGEVELIAPYGQLDAVLGLEQFSHIWLLWQFHHISMQSFNPKVRPPRLGGNQKLGVFATRSTNRPSNIGLSVVKLHAISQKDELAVLHISGMDMVDGTPVIDIKPYLAYSDSVVDAHSGYAHSVPQTLPVIWSDEAVLQRTALQMEGKINAQQCEHINALLALNPKPAYHRDERRYGIRFADFDIGYQHHIPHDTHARIVIIDIACWCSTHMDY